MKSICNVTHIPLSIYKAGMFPCIKIQHLVVNLDGEVIWSLGRRWEGTPIWGNEENQDFSFIEGSRRDSGEQE